MNHYRDSVASKPHVELDAIGSCGHRSFKSDEGIFRRHGRCTAMTYDQWLRHSRLAIQKFATRDYAKLRMFDRSVELLTFPRRVTAPINPVIDFCKNVVSMFDLAESLGVDYSALNVIREGYEAAYV
jgi:hypothetical protein